MSWKERDYLCLVYKCQSDSSLLDREILSEYWSNRILLISLKTWFGSRFFQVAKCLLTNSMASLFVGTYLREKGRIPKQYRMGWKERDKLCIQC